MSDKRLVAITMKLNDGRKLKIQESKIRAEIAKLSNNYSNMLKKVNKKLSAVLTGNR
jgi:hypothetical protein